MHWSFLLEDSEVLFPHRDSFKLIRDFFNREKKISFQISFIFEVLLKEQAPLCSLLCSNITQCDTYQTA